VRLDAWKGLAFLFPNAQLVTDYALRVVNGEAVIDTWNLPDPIPTDAEIEQAVLDWEAEEERLRLEAEAEKADHAATRDRIRTAAQSAVGVAFDQLTTTQLRALFAILLYREGALNRHGIVRPLPEWVKLGS
jgi:hypothetical protein